MNMDIALKNKLKEIGKYMLIYGGIYLTGYMLDETRRTVSDSLGTTIFLVEAILAIAAIIVGIIMLTYIPWMLKELFNFLPTIFKSIIHLKIQPHTTLCTQKAQQERAWYMEQNRRAAERQRIAEEEQRKAKSRAERILYRGPDDAPKF